MFYFPTKLLRKFLLSRRLFHENFVRNLSRKAESYVNTLLMVSTIRVLLIVTLTAQLCAANFSQFAWVDRKVRRLTLRYHYQPTFPSPLSHPTPVLRQHPLILRFRCSSYDALWGFRRAVYFCLLSVPAAIFFIGCLSRAVVSPNHKIWCGNGSGYTGSCAASSFAKSSVKRASASSYESSALSDSKVLLSSASVGVTE